MKKLGIKYEPHHLLQPFHAFWINLEDIPVTHNLYGTGDLYQVSDKWKGFF